ncbi:PD-(D/E)XK nuclease family protein [Clostridium bowmanii]|uniref:PD-(D/E)XK nuclease family protein n=1 Tax=Clostridium bowmanii TaxID=132925 RepID=UPI001C0B3B55|nr:PD-(D/E)XK nuclease family protein [Clostridium bowmanii]MBU3189950.1 PD-(D/E)XK nuclease family protein [Clostridium bowmanii]MCA1074616.1 PD-(D/E)XK nuclease family protein [Clostridium bowmanii]
MNKIIYFEKLFTKRRENLLEYCSELQKCGKNFIYILPSREAIMDVRYALIEKNKGIINSYIITFDELEELIVDPYISKERIIYEEFEQILIQGICKKSIDNLTYYTKICTKKGFIEEIRTFIKALKRQTVTEDNLLNIVRNEENEILKSKLEDIYIIYKAYNKSLSENNVYDINDISLKAVEFAKSSKVFDEFDAIIIDGFINIDVVNLELINEISKSKDIDIYVNSSFRNHLIEPFIRGEIVNKLKIMDFHIVEDIEEEYKSDEKIKQISKMLYSGEKLNIDENPKQICKHDIMQNSCEKFKCIKINKYPCIEAEVRETARDIKKSLMNGDKASEIALFVNKSTLYSSIIIKIFKEFKIPVEMIYKIPLTDSLEVRKIIASFEKNEEEDIKSASQWLNILEEKFLRYHEIIKPVFLNGLSSDLCFEDKVLLKGYEGLKRLLKNLRNNFEICHMLENNMESVIFADFLKDYALNSTITIENMNTDGVKILNTDLAKGVFYKHVYILGLNEGEVPKVVRNAGLFTDMEVDKLYKQGINYRNYRYELSREKIRFNLTLAAAKETLTLSYRGASEEGGFAIASSFVDEIKFLTGIKEERVLTMRDRFNININEVMSELELKTVVLKDIFEKYYKGFTDKNIDKRISYALEFEVNIVDYYAKCFVEYHREVQADYNNYEGWIGSEYAQGKIEYFKPSAVGSYFRCPYQYFMQQFFGIRDVEESENAFNNLEIGTFYHEILKRYYENTSIEELYLLDNGKIDLVFNEDKFNKIFDDEAQNLRVLDIEDDRKENILEGYRNTLNNFLELDVKRMKKYLKDTKNILVPFLIEEKIKEKAVFGIPISCVVDRVDLEFEYVDNQWMPTGKYMVYDYKKRSISDIGAILAREDCQIVIYYYMVEYILKNRFSKLFKNRELDCMGLIYLSIENQNKTGLVKEGLYRTEYKASTDFGRKHFDVNIDMFNILTEYVRDLVIEAASDIKQGKFNYKSNCSSFDGKSFGGYSCSFKNVCRYNKNKLLLQNTVFKGGTSDVH